MNTISDTTISLDHIMWQPTFACMSNCKGCYVRESESASYKGINTSLLTALFETKTVRTTQLTIALDTMYHVPHELIEAIKVAFEKCADEEIELCVTAHTPVDLNRWQVKLAYPTLRAFLKPVTMVSLSNFPSLGKLCDELREEAEAARTLINYNRLVTKKDLVNSKQFEMGLRYADHAYFVYHKAPLGEAQSQEYLDNLLSVWLTAKYKTERAKVKLDHCIVDAKNRATTGRLCGAGISKVHVWPNGAVTGCPYDSHRIMDGGHEDITYDTEKEIRRVLLSKNHPMTKCQILWEEK